MLLAEERRRLQQDARDVAAMRAAQVREAGGSQPPPGSVPSRSDGAAPPSRSNGLVSREISGNLPGAGREPPVQTAQQQGALQMPAGGGGSLLAQQQAEKAASQLQSSAPMSGIPPSAGVGSHLVPAGYGGALSGSPGSHLAPAGVGSQPGSYVGAPISRAFQGAGASSAGGSGSATGAVSQMDRLMASGRGQRQPETPGGHTDGLARRHTEGLSHARELSGHSGGDPVEAARVRELQVELKRAGEALVAKERLAADRAAEIKILKTRLTQRDTELQRLKVDDSRRLQAAAARPQADRAMSLGPKEPERPPQRLVHLESENSRLRAMVDALQRPRSNHAGSDDSSSDPRERAARRLQRMARLWIAGLRRQRQDSSSARDRWRQTLHDVEAAVARALDTALGQADIGRVPRQTRLQLLANALKQGVLKVNQAMMQQTLQDLRRSTSSGPLSPVSGISASSR